jgi:hypothetical protein
VGCFLILAVVSGIYFNYKLDQVVQSLNRPGIVYMDAAPETGHEGKADIENPDINDGVSSSPQPQGDTGGTMPSLYDSYMKGRTQGRIGKDDIVSGVQQQVSRPIEKKDLLKAGLIIIRKLSWEEIEYMYEVGTKASISSAELKEVHRILSSRLSEEEIQVMMELGRKYGKDLEFLGAKPQ